MLAFIKWVNHLKKLRSFSFFPLHFYGFHILCNEKRLLPFFCRSCSNCNLSFLKICSKVQTPLIRALPRNVTISIHASCANGLNSWSNKSHIVPTTWLQKSRTVLSLNWSSYWCKHWAIFLIHGIKHLQFSACNVVGHKWTKLEAWKEGHFWMEIVRTFLFPIRQHCERPNQECCWKCGNVCYSGREYGEYSKPIALWKGAFPAARQCPAMTYSAKCRTSAKVWTIQMFPFQCPITTGFSSGARSKIRSKAKKPKQRSFPANCLILSLANCHDCWMASDCSLLSTPSSPENEPDRREPRWWWMPPLLPNRRCWWSNGDTERLEEQRNGFISRQILS